MPLIPIDSNAFPRQQTSWHANASLTKYSCYCQSKQGYHREADEDIVESSVLRYSDSGPHACNVDEKRYAQKDQQHNWCCPSSFLGVDVVWFRPVQHDLWRRVKSSTTSDKATSMGTLAVDVHAKVCGLGCRTCKRERAKGKSSVVQSRRQ